MKTYTTYLFTAFACVAIAVVGFSLFYVAVVNFALGQATWDDPYVPVMAEAAPGDEIEVGVVYATIDLKPGDQLSRQAVRTEQVPRRLAVPGSIRAKDLDDLEGVFIKEKIYSGEMIISDRISVTDGTNRIPETTGSSSTQSSDHKSRAIPAAGGGPPPAAL